MRFSMVLSLPLLLGACSNTVTSTRDGQSEGNSNLVQNTAPRQATHQHTVTDANDPTAQLRASCALRLNELGVDAEIAPGSDHAEVSVESHAIGDPDCADFAWVRGFVKGVALIEPDWSGPDRGTTGWDCNHSSLEYGVYRRLATDWEYVGGGLAYGNLEDGSCGYSVDNFPAQAGSDSVVVQGDRTDAPPTEVRVALRAWTHNDPAYGHSGTDCENLSCFWPAALRWEAE